MGKSNCNTKNTPTEVFFPRNREQKRNSAKFCPGVCAYPFAVPKFIPGLKAKKSPNGDVGVDGMISVIGHEIAELASNPLVNAWYAGQDPSAPVEIADLCEGIYGTGGGGSYTGQLLEGHDGATYNMNGIRRRHICGTSTTKTFFLKHLLVSEDMHAAAGLWHQLPSKDRVLGYWFCM
ncbi:hypothetical protein RCOM_1499820 [Ricinus communis]|uniref:Uncharacterized protein n=1 Tax=Ricinus communis TaxID=3988 RepID=B9R9P8_RICCO|nr:hypothetical protein RCOM_1499820 [Ricinus communis]